MKKIVIMSIISIAIIILFSGCVNKGGDNIQPTPTSTIPEPTVSEKAQKVVGLAKEDLANTISTSVNNIKLTSIEEMTWSDSSLGYPEPGGQYLTVETPGYKILLSYGGVVYEYHSDYERIVPPPPEKKGN